MTTQKKHIETEFEVKQRFDKLQADLKFKGIRKTKSELVDMLINIFKEHIKIEKVLLEKISALESYTERLESGERILK